jgi:hypothetical protein
LFGIQLPAEHKGKLPNGNATVDENPSAKGCPPEKKG